MGGEAKNWRDPTVSHLFPRRADSADNTRARFHRKLRGKQTHAPADGIDQNRLPRLEAMKGMEHVIAGHGSKPVESRQLTHQTHEIARESDINGTGSGKRLGPVSIG